MDYIDTHKNRIRISANKNPLKAYFLGALIYAEPNKRSKSLHTCSNYKQKRKMTFTKELPCLMSFFVLFFVLSTGEEDA